MNAHHGSFLRVVPFFASFLTALACGQDAQDPRINAWLFCVECIAGERDTVVAMEDAAVPSLEAALYGPDGSARANFRAQATEAWLGSDRLVDSATYVDRFLDNRSALMARRSASALAGIGTPGAIDALDSALARHASGTVTFRGDVVRRLHEALYVVRGAVDWAEVLPAQAHTCGKLSSGQPLCWGSQADGLLGNGLAAGLRTVPGGVKTETASVSLDAGIGNSCLATPADVVACWGSRSHGQVGDGVVSADPALYPTVVPSLAAQGVAVGARHTCALDSSGAVWCWGANDREQVGSGSIDPVVRVPVRVDGLPPLESITAGDVHTCGLTGAGQAWCWGGNDRGQLGDGSTVDRASPVPVPMVHPSLWIDAGGQHTCASDRLGQPFCWGRGTEGQLGDGGGGDVPVPVPVEILPGTSLRAVSAGERHSCAVADDGRAFCWGLGEGGRLGDGSDSGSALTPTEVEGGHRWLSVRAGRHTCGIDDQRRAFCWGPGSSGQIGDGGTIARTTPTRVLEPERSS